jgi:hypothetical protein
MARAPLQPCPRAASQRNQHDTLQHGESLRCPIQAMLSWIDSCPEVRRVQGSNPGATLFCFALRWAAREVVLDTNTRYLNLIHKRVTVKHNGVLPAPNDEWGGRLSQPPKSKRTSVWPLNGHIHTTCNHEVEDAKCSGSVLKSCAHAAHRAAPLLFATP